MKLDLAEIKKRWQVRTVLAVTIESGRVAVDLIRREETESKVVKSFVLALGADAVVAEGEKAGKELAAQLVSHGIARAALRGLRAGELGADDFHRCPGDERRRLCAVTSSCARNANFRSR